MFLPNTLFFHRSLHTVHRRPKFQNGFSDNLFATVVYFGITSSASNRAKYFPLAFCIAKLAAAPNPKFSFKL